MAKTATFTKQHFEFLAREFKEGLANGSVTLDFVRQIAQKFTSTNPAFDVDRFMKAATGKPY